MKKMLFVIASCFACFLAFSKLNAQTAYATGSEPYFSIEVSEAEAGTVIGNPNTSSFVIPTDNNEYYTLSVSIHDNPGYADSGFTITYNGDCYEPVIRTNTVDTPVFVKGNGAEELLLKATLNLQTHLFAVSTIGSVSSGNDGIIVTFVLKKRTDATGTNFGQVVTNFHLACLLDEVKNDIIDTGNNGGNNGGGNSGGNNSGINLYEHEHTLYYTLGDINGDGVVDLDDAQVLYQIVSANGNYYRYRFNASPYSDVFDTNIRDCDGMYLIDDDYNVVFIAEIADVDDDGVIDVDDAFDILDYYTYHLANPNYTSDIGSTFAYTYYTYDTNP